MRPPFEGGGGPRCAMPTRTPHPFNDLGGVDGIPKVVESAANGLKLISVIRATGHTRKR
jgi:hypothetical protein